MSDKPKAFSYVRFSTPEQLKGDSLRRQQEASQAYAEQKGLILDDSLSMNDQGLSAFHGVHRDKGALGAFLKLVEDGKIPSGSVLIVENLDRLSREQVLDALNQFTSIIKAGITLVTLQDGQEYSQESIDKNWSQLIISITYMARAYEESKAKSQRLKAVWENKREMAISENKNMTGRLPSWLRLSEDGNELIVIPEVADAVESIFQRKAAGKGATRIETEMNADPTIWKPENGWRKSYINKLLPDRRLIGEFQPCTLNDGKRKPEGDPIPDYFPQVIDTDLFYAVQSILKSNSHKAGRGGGRTNKCKNLFGGIAKCGLCGAPLHFINKGPLPKGGQYLVCDGQRRLKTCDAKPIRYDEFERLFLADMEEIDISDLLPNNDEVQAQINEVERALVANHQRLEEIQAEISNLSDTIAKTNHAKVREQLEGRLVQSFEDQEHLQTDTEEMQTTLKNLTVQKESLQANIDKTAEIYTLLENAEGEQERANIRYQLKNQIQRIVDKIKVYPLMEKYREIQEVEPDVFKVMDSKYIDRISIYFKGVKKRRLLLLKSHGEVL